MRVDVRRGVGVRVREGVADGVAVTVLAQLLCFGVPLRGLGGVVQGGVIVQSLGVPASTPHATTPVLVIHAVSLSTIAARRSMLPNVVELPAGQAPPFELAVSMRLIPLKSCRISLLFPIAPEYIWSALISETVVSSVRSSRKRLPARSVPLRLMVGVPSAPLKVQPDKLMSAVVVFRNSIHSSFDEATVPAQATSLIIMLRSPIGVGVRVIVDVVVDELVLVAVGVSEGVLVEVKVGGGAPQRLKGVEEF